jgi:hypothetical protein
MEPISPVIPLLEIMVDRMAHDQPGTIEGLADCLPQLDDLPPGYVESESDPEPTSVISSWPDTPQGSPPEVTYTTSGFRVKGNGPTGSTRVNADHSAYELLLERHGDFKKDSATVGGIGIGQLTIYSGSPITINHRGRTLWFTVDFQGPWTITGTKL